MSLKSLLGWAGFAAACTATTVGCSVYDPDLVPDDGDQNCVSGTVGCLPARPARSTSSTGDSMEVAYAMRDVLIAQSLPNLSPTDNAQPWRSIGFNLDDVDTTSREAPVSCRNQYDPSLGVDEVYPIDGQNGVDNAFGAALYANFVGQVYPELQGGLSCNEALGRGTIILRVRDWNGQPDDASVRVSIMISKDATSTTEPVQWNNQVGAKELALSSTGGTTAAPDPSWVADMDTYYIGTTEVSGGDLDDPRHEDADAYIRDGYIVMRIDPGQSIKLYLGSENGIAIGLKDGRLIAHITPDGAYLDTGTMGGRMGQAELKDAATRLIGSSAVQNDCDTIVQTIDPLIDAYGDILANSGDGANPDAPCNALSVGVKFRGVRVRQLRLADGEVCIPFPMCDGGSYKDCDETAEDTTCPWAGTPMATFPAWSGP